MADAAIGSFALASMVIRPRAGLAAGRFGRRPLMLVGRLSDRVGRGPVAAAGLLPAALVVAALATRRDTPALA